jgi:hypothetical protein
MVEFKSESCWRTAGAPKLFIPPEIREWMDKSYRINEVCILPMEEGDDDSADFVKLLTNYARSEGHSAFHQFFIGENGESYIRFKMRDKRPYRRPSRLAREKR